MGIYRQQSAAEAVAEDLSFFPLRFVWGACRDDRKRLPLQIGYKGIARNTIFVGSRPSEVKSSISWKGRRRAVSTNEIPLTSTTAWRSGKSEVGNRKMTFAGTSTGWLASGSSVAPTLRVRVAPTPAR